jgi:hypothetical protein
MTDPYQRICAAMTPGLLVSVNESGGSQRNGAGEMEVLLVDDESGKVELRASDGLYRIRHDSPNETVLEAIDRDGYGRRETIVETIEVIGIDD